MPDLRPSLLAVFAHPDDEGMVGGTLAMYAARGVRVTLAVATRGEAGKVSPLVGEVPDLGVFREGEMCAACERLGIEAPVFLGFHDSGRNERLRRDDPLATANAEYLEVEARIRAVIEAVRPQVMITFDPHGGYGHPDHLAVHRAATAAFFSSGWMGTDAPRRLFYTAMTGERVRYFQRMSPSVAAGLDPHVYAVSDETVAARIDVSDFLEAKRGAFLAHASQAGSNPARGGILDPEVEAMMREVMRYETFSLGATRGPVTQWPLPDLFAGLDLSA
ncbi:MAG TPA: PIG-L family deacetylase [Deinococcales bacterium]|nr:PIG-L family deacetylase [Deinococcales bacterium]